ncbi:hypothetical protein [Cupriavidus necator]
MTIIDSLISCFIDKSHFKFRHIDYYNNAVHYSPRYDARIMDNIAADNYIRMRHSRSPLPLVVPDSQVADEISHNHRRVIERGLLQVLVQKKGENGPLKEASAVFLHGHTNRPGDWTLNYFDKRPSDPDFINASWKFSRIRDIANQLFLSGVKYMPVYVLADNSGAATYATGSSFNAIKYAARVHGNQKATAQRLADYRDMLHRESNIDKPAPTIGYVGTIITTATPPAGELPRTLQIEGGNTKLNLAAGEIAFQFNEKPRPHRNDEYALSVYVEEKNELYQRRETLAQSAQGQEHQQQANTPTGGGIQGGDAAQAGQARLPSKPEEMPSQQGALTTTGSALATILPDDRRNLSPTTTSSSPEQLSARTAPAAEYRLPTQGQNSGSPGIRKETRV